MKEKALSQGSLINNLYTSYPTNLVPLKPDDPQLKKNVVQYIVLYKN